MKKTNEVMRKIMILMIITVIPIISIHTYRYFFMDGLPSGQEAYKNLLISEKVGAETTPYHYILNYGSRFFDLQIFSQIFSLIMGITTVIIFYLILKEFFDEETSFISASLLALSPIFISKFSIPSVDAFFVLILLATLFIIIKLSDSAYFYLVIPLAITASFFGFFYTIIYVFSCTIMSLKFKNKKTIAIGGKIRYDETLCLQRILRKICFKRTFLKLKMWSL